MTELPDGAHSRLVWLTIPHATPQPVQATLTRNPPLDRLDGAERAWTPARLRLTARQRHHGRVGVIQHGHWNWTNKGQWFRSGVWRLVAVESGPQVEGLMAVAARPSVSRLVPPEPLVYIDFLESAPWNNRELTHPDPPHRAGIGLNLLADAVLWSVQAGWGGRVGLHALPQASGFYTRHGMTLVDPADPNYYDLPYFEYTSTVAANWLAALGMTP